jgi:tRNA(His) 5'-end guanylyltransferase
MAVVSTAASAFSTSVFYSVLAAFCFPISYLLSFDSFCVVYRSRFSQLLEILPWGYFATSFFHFLSFFFQLLLIYSA